MLCTHDIIMVMNIIAFTGKKESGKTTASNYVLKVLLNAKIVSFKSSLIDEIKQNFPQLLAEIFNIYKNSIEGLKVVEDLFTIKPPLMRTLLQNYGTEVRRGDDADYWVHKWVEKVGDSLKESLILVDDVRFKNESDTVKNLGGVLIRVVKLDAMISSDTHSSEHGMDMLVPDYTIEVKTGEHDKLEEELSSILKELKYIQPLPTAQAQYL